MFGTIRRHQTWLWVVVATITIVSLVVYFNPASRSGGNDHSGDNYGVIGGHKITADQWTDAQNEVMLGHRLSGRPIDQDSAEVKRETYQTLFFNAKEEELGIQITPEAASAFARRYVLGQQRLDDFVNSVLKPTGLSEEDFAHFLRHQAALMQLETIVGTSGTLATAAEAENIYLSQNREVASTMVYFPFTNYLTKVTNSPGDIGQFYTNNVTNYAVPEKRVVTYVKFDTTNYLAGAKAALTNLDHLVSQIYDEAGTNLPDGAKTPDEAKAKIREELLTNQAERLAGQAANGFAQQLDQGPQHPEELARLAKTNGWAVQTTPPFDGSGPEGLKVSALFIRDAFGLSSNDVPFSGVIAGDDGAYVLAFKERIPSWVPPLKDVESKVAADLRELKAQQMALDAAAKFSGTVEDELNVNNGVTLPKDFATIAAENDLKLETLPPLALTTTNLPPDLERRVGLAALRNAAFNVAPGTAGKARSAAEGAFVLYVDKFLPADTAKLQTLLPAFLAKFRSARQNEAFNLWYNHEIGLDPGMVAIYGDLDKQEQAATAPGARK